MLELAIDCHYLMRFHRWGCAVAKVVCCGKIQQVRLIQAKAEKEARQSCSVKRSQVFASVPEFRSMAAWV